MSGCGRFSRQYNISKVVIILRERIVLEQKKIKLMLSDTKDEESDQQNLTKVNAEMKLVLMMLNGLSSFPEHNCVRPLERMHVAGETNTIHVSTYENNEE